MLLRWLNKLGHLALAIALAASPVGAQEFNIFLPYNVVSAPACTAVSIEDTATLTDQSADVNTSVAIGTANANRYIAIFVGTDTNSVNSAITSITVGGVSATQKSLVFGTGDSRTGLFWITDSPVATGTTATLVIDFASPPVFGVAVYAVTCPQDPDPAASGGAIATDTTVASNAVAATLNIPSNGAGVGFAFCGSSGTFTWTNLTEDFDTVAESDHQMSGASSTTSGSSTRTATHTSCADGDGFLILASWGRTATPRLYPATCVADTANATTYNSAAFQAVAVPNLSNSASVVVYVGVLSEDNAATFGVDSMTIEGAAATEIVDEDGTGIVNTAFYRTDSTITSAASLNVSVTHSEALTGNATICVWAAQNLASATPDSSIADDDTSSGALVLTLGTTNSTGFGLGVCLNSGAAGTTTWAVLTEREDTQHAEADYSNADASATGASMSVTCDWTGTNDASGAAIAIH